MDCHLDGFMEKGWKETSQATFFFTGKVHITHSSILSQDFKSLERGGGFVRIDPGVISTRGPLF